jgi:hypothetical protein
MLRRWAALIDDEEIGHILTEQDLEAANATGGIDNVTVAVVHAPPAGSVET